MTVSTELTKKQREVIFKDMDAVTQEVALSGQKTFLQGMQVAALLAHDLGTLVNNVFTAEHLNETQRKQEIQKLAAFWNQADINPTKLYDLRNVAVAFSRSFLQEQVEEPMSDGNYLTWSHFRELQKVNGEKKQLAILKKIRRNSWSANELSLELSSKGAVAVKRSGGRKPGLPKTPHGMLHKLFLTVGHAKNYLEAVTVPLEGNFLEMSADEVDDKFLENVDETLERLSQTHEEIASTVKRLQKVKERTITVLNNREEGESSRSVEPVEVALAAKQLPEVEVPAPKPRRKRTRKAPRRSSKS